MEGSEQQCDTFRITLAQGRTILTVRANAQSLGEMGAAGSRVNAVRGRSSIESDTAPTVGYERKKPDDDWDPLAQGTEIMGVDFAEMGEYCRRYRFVMGWSAIKSSI